MNGKTFVERFIINCIEAYDLEEGLIEERIKGGVDCDVEEGPENVVDHILEAGDQARFFIDLVEAWDLNKPPDFG